MRKAEDLSQSVHDAGGRMTRQRRIVLEALASVTSHPTAAELYDLVRERLPDISPGTVYRNHNVLTELGYVQELCFGPNASRFDANLEIHHHIRCERCGRVADIHAEPDADLEDSVPAPDGWTITSQRLEFHGLCPDCRQAQEHPDDQEGESQ